MRTLTPRVVVLSASASILTLGLLATGATSASASGNPSKGEEVRRSGSCSGATDWKLKVKTDDARLEVEFEVDSNVTGQAWRVRITDNGATTFTGTRRTAGPSGSFSVEQKVANLAGTDRVVATATNPATGETCRGVIPFPA